MNEAAMAALEEKLTSSSRSPGVPWTITDAHFKKALGKISPSVSDKVPYDLPLHSSNLRRTDSFFAALSLIDAFFVWCSKYNITSFCLKASKLHENRVDVSNAFL